MSGRYLAHRRKWKNCQKCPLCRSRGKIVLARGKIPSPLLLVGESPGESENVIGRPFIGPAGKLLDRILKVAVDGRVDYAITNLVACIPKFKLPKVVNLRKEEHDVKICRGTEWGNPFRIGPDGTREEVIEKYRKWLPKQPKLMKKLGSLSGQRLGCFCQPKPCHGDAIVEVFREKIRIGKASDPPLWAVEACRLRLEEFIEMSSPRRIVAVGKTAADHLPVKPDAEIIHPAAILRADITQQGLMIQRATVILEDVVEGVLEQMS